ncbi:MAG TPA: hypothetical protein VNT76_03610 [Candidatus Binatus sp.]|nr:hypothetical protein [Candidatus Binatus sp.]
MSERPINAATGEPGMVELNYDGILTINTKECRLTAENIQRRTK